MEEKDSLELGKKIRNYRKTRKLTIKELSEKTNLTASMLSQIERNLVNPSISTLKIISKVLDIPLFMFFKEEETQDLIVRSNNRKIIGIPNEKEVRYDLLTPNTKGNIEFCMMHIPKNNFSGNMTQSHKGEEVAYVVEGNVIIQIEEDSYELFQGDSIRIPPLTEHKWINNSEEEVKVVFAITPPSF